MPDLVFPIVGNISPRWRKDIKEAFKQFLFISVSGIALLVRHFIFLKIKTQLKITIKSKEKKI
jgi:hypothetical protein